MSTRIAHSFRRHTLGCLLALSALCGAGAAEAKVAFIGPHGNPVAALPAGKAGRLVIGVMGGAGAHVPETLSRDIRLMGAEIAKKGHVTLSGACPGLPHEAIIGAKQAGGLTVGISGHRSRKAHVAMGAPVDHLDVIQVTSLPPVHKGQQRPNYMGREIDNIERSNALIFVGGRSGTLGEFAIAYEEGRPIGVLTGSGGVTDQIKKLVPVMTEAGKPPRAPIIYGKDPKSLVRRLIKATEEHKPAAFHWEG